MGNNGKINNILIPQLSKVPGQKNIDISDKLKNGNDNEFKNLLREKIGEIKEDHGIKLSTHAAKRLQERSLIMDGDEFYKLKNALNKLKEKGGKDSLVITDNAAYILDVDKNTIVTAIDKTKMSDNVFTKIDSTIYVE